MKSASDVRFANPVDLSRDNLVKRWDWEASESRVVAILDDLDQITAHHLAAGGEAAAAAMVWWAFIEEFCGCDDAWAYRDDVLAYMRRYKAYRLEAFSDDQRPTYTALPELVQVYRGCSRDRVQGISWSLSKDIAADFARGHRGIATPDPVIASALIRKDDIFATIDEREEQEVLLDPFCLIDVSVEDYIRQPL